MDRPFAGADMARAPGIAGQGLPRRAALLLTAAAVLVASSLALRTAGAQSLSSDPAALLNRIEFLERQVRYLSERQSDNRQAAESRDVKEVPAVDPAASAAAAGGGAATARLAVRIGELEQDIRSVTGRMEDVSFQVRRLNERLDKLSTDLEYRLSQKPTGEGGAPPAVAGPGRTEFGGAAAGGSRLPSPQTGPVVLGAVPTQPELPQARAPEPPPPAPASASAPAPVAAPPAVPPAGPTAPAAAAPVTPREVYASAFAQLQREKYPEAEAGFQQFLKRYPDDPLAENANYWLAESYYAQGDYARAATTFLEGYEKHKKGAKAADTLLKLAMSLGRLNKKPEACATLQELGRAFPGAPSAIKTKAGEERRRLGCS